MTRTNKSSARKERSEKEKAMHQFQQDFIRNRLVMYVSTDRYAELFNAGLINPDGSINLERIQSNPELYASKQKYLPDNIP